MLLWIWIPLVLLGIVVRTHRPQVSPLEQKLLRDKLVLVPCGRRVFTPGEPRAAGRITVAPAEILKTHQLYVRSTVDPDSSLLIDRAGVIYYQNQPTGEIQDFFELIETDENVVIQAGGRIFAFPAATSDLFWACRTASLPPVEPVPLPLIQLSDGFMRTQLEADGCRLRRGQWELAQHGGGMATTEYESHSYDFRRAVNPFSLHGQNFGSLAYGDTDWFNYHAQASFYFGVPRTGEITDQVTVPVDTDMLVAQGDPTGMEVAFGWRGKARAFQLLTRKRGGEWSVLASRAGKRPPLTNWMTVGLQVKSGLTAEGFLDGEKVLSAPAPGLIRGGFTIESGKAPVECDDIAAWSLPRPPEPGTPLMTISTGFGEKKKKEKSDPDEFDHWARGGDTFFQKRLIVKGIPALGMITSLPLVGDFSLETKPAAEDGSLFPEGVYDFLLLPGGFSVLDQLKKPSLAKASFIYRDSRWFPVSPAADSAFAGDLPVLRLARSQATGMALALRVNDQWRSLSDPVTGPVFLVISRRMEDSRTTYPHSRHFTIRSPNVVHEFFEHSPTEWRWIEGAFRMASRWACQPEWNFMACGGTGAPFMSSRKTFHGDQTHQYFMSLRPVMPYDAGDTTFQYSVDDDRRDRFRELHNNQGWYVKHDLNFSFCGDGVNPLSGYAVVFGGHDNRETLLLRRGQVVSRTTDPAHLFSGEWGIRAVHWKWWEFTVQRYGNRIQVFLNGDPLFDYTDPDPLAGGHIGFFTVRGGFALARVTSQAEKMGHVNDLLYVADDAQSCWKPLITDSVEISPVAGQGARWRVAAAAGAGFQAVRYRPDRPVDLSKTPILTLPFKPEETKNVHVFMTISGRSYMVQARGATTKMKSLLTPQYEKGECFRIPEISPSILERRMILGGDDCRDGVLTINLAEAVMKRDGPPGEMILTDITIGNTSNEDYLLAGNGNPAGGAFTVGVPEFSARPDAE
ncbi:MAG: hypothetical protein RRC34_15180 [Lentisphaeria bacterium]|nr:hypothetical protein [Lentisphaeria bacterium]